MALASNEFITLKWNSSCVSLANVSVVPLMGPLSPALLASIEPTFDSLAILWCYGLLAAFAFLDDRLPEAKPPGSLNDG